MFSIVFPPSFASIHAPPRGATCLWTPQGAIAPCFNSRPSARGDPIFQRQVRKRGRFNSRPSARGDSEVATAVAVRAASIHAPPRGATRRRPRTVVGCRFNSRPSARGDGKRYAISANLLFNPYKSAWLNNSATQFVEIILVIFHRIIA